eukprot:CAMPEP_0196685384 /NCGR_PEP_ID=MMETSP1090-20130531/11175_1 /TAXON_ID=37098 /ORGANISM="Isochrysis sp, Strain CCMP1244" /LENGTH=141 /DNA_ID=CAMNT_0042023905 /DNA_START=81 /DNA_END=503 /DNA_ORIENTATION=-
MRLSSAPAKASVKRGEAGQGEDDVEGLLRQLRAPVPRRRESAVDAGPGVEKVVAARAVKGEAEEVAQDGARERAHAAKGRVDPGADLLVVGVQLRERVEGGEERVEDVLHLRVLVDEEQRVWDVRVAQVHQRRVLAGGAHP